MYTHAACKVLTYVRVLCAVMSYVHNNLTKLGNHSKKHMQFRTDNAMCKEKPLCLWSRITETIWPIQLVLLHNHFSIFVLYFRWKATMVLHGKDSVYESLPTISWPPHVQSTNNSSVDSMTFLTVASHCTCIPYQKWRHLNSRKLLGSIHAKWKARSHACANKPLVCLILKKSGALTSLHMGAFNHFNYTDYFCCYITWFRASTVSVT